MAEVSTAGAGTADPDGVDLYLLAVKARQVAQRAAQVLSQHAVAEAAPLAREGFIVPAPEALSHAAQVFSWVAQRPGGEDAMRLLDPAVRLQLIVDLVTQWDAAAEALDLSWSASWAALARENAADLSAARAVRRGWLGEGRPALLERMQADQMRHYNEETWRR